jgi:protein-L-isoaspartate(D-aspartate) O-methyltransferase
MVDFAQARRTMVDSQLRTFDVNDIPLLDAMASVPRERFVPSDREGFAYIDQDLQVAGGDEPRFMLSPMIQARLIQALSVRPGMRVLDVACGLGYSSAVLRELGAEVVAIDTSQDLVDKARERLKSAGGAGIEVIAAELDQGYPDRGLYDAILVNGAVERRPDRLLQQLAEGGRLVCVVGSGRSAKATLYVRSGQAYGSRSLFDAAAPVLQPFRVEPGFAF